MNNPKEIKTNPGIAKTRSKANEIIAPLVWLLDICLDLSLDLYKTKGLDKNPDPLFIILR